MKLKTEKTDYIKINIAVQMLKGILQWSDRIGSDEIHEIQQTINILKK
jgi:hypothetical protein